MRLKLWYRDLTLSRKFDSDRYCKLWGAYSILACMILAKSIVSLCGHIRGNLLFLQIIISTSKSTGKRRELCTKLTIKALERRE